MSQNVEDIFCAAVARGKLIPSERNTGMLMAEAPPPDMALNALAINVLENTMAISIPLAISIFEYNDYTQSRIYKTILQFARIRD